MLNVDSRTNRNTLPIFVARCVAIELNGQRCTSLCPDKTTIYCQKHKSICQSQSTNQSLCKTISSDFESLLNKDIQSLDQAELKIFIAEIREYYFQHDRCLKQRRSYKQTCVQNEDDSVDVQYHLEQQQQQQQDDDDDVQQKFDTILLLATQRILKLKQVDDDLKNQRQKELDEQNKQRWKKELENIHQHEDNQIISEQQHQQWKTLQQQQQEQQEADVHMYMYMHQQSMQSMQFQQWMQFQQQPVYVPIFQPHFQQPSMIQAQNDIDKRFLNSFDAISIPRESQPQSQQQSSSSSSSSMSDRVKSLALLDQTLVSTFGYLDSEEYTSAIDVSVYISLGRHRNIFDTFVKLAGMWRLMPMLTETKRRITNNSRKQLFDSVKRIIRDLYNKWNNVWINSLVPTYCYPVRYFQHYCQTSGFKSFLVFQLSQPVFTDVEVKMAVDWILELLKLNSFFKQNVHDIFTSVIMFVPRKIFDESKFASVHDTIYLEIKDHASERNEITIQSCCLINMPNDIACASSSTSSSTSSCLYKPISTIYFYTQQQPNHQTQPFPFRAGLQRTQRAWRNPDAGLPPMVRKV